MNQDIETIRTEIEIQYSRLAVLIDADNAQASVIEAVLSEVARYGVATVRRIYGDFTSPSNSTWKKFLNRYSIKPIQQFAYTTGKNATDSTMIIDAMDLLYTLRFDGFCLVTSDSDFTGLAVRLREGGLKVYGFGEKKTPEAFRNACHKFIYTELFRSSVSTVLSEPVSATSDPEIPTQEQLQSIEADSNKPSVPFQFLMEALERTADDTGWSHLGTFGGYLRNIQPAFDSRMYGFKKLSDLLRAYPEVFITEERVTEGGNYKVIYVKEA